MIMNLFRKLALVVILKVAFVWFFALGVASSCPKFEPLGKIKTCDIRMNAE